MVLIHVIDGEEILWSEKFACIECNYSLPDLEPNMFSFNAPFGACPECKGLGFKTAISEDLLVPDKTLSINEGAIQTLKDDTNIFYTNVKTACDYYHIDMNKPYKELTKKKRKFFFMVVMNHYNLNIQLKMVIKDLPPITMKALLLI